MSTKFGQNVDTIVDAETRASAGLSIYIYNCIQKYIYIHTHTRLMMRACVCVYVFLRLQR